MPLFSTHHPSKRSILGLWYAPHPVWLCMCQLSDPRVATHLAVHQHEFDFRVVLVLLCELFKLLGDPRLWCRYPHPTRVSLRATHHVLALTGVSPVWCARATDPRAVVRESRRS
eukprot:9128680-Pyramimonas_sp.AAC.1